MTCSANQPSASRTLLHLLVSSITRGMQGASQSLQQHAGQPNKAALALRAAAAACCGQHCTFSRCPEPSFSRCQLMWHPSPLCFLCLPSAIVCPQPPHSTLWYPSLCPTAPSLRLLCLVHIVAPPSCMQPHLSSCSLVSAAALPTPAACMSEPQCPLLSALPHSFLHRPRALASIP